MSEKILMKSYLLGAIGLLIFSAFISPQCLASCPQNQCTVPQPNSELVRAAQIVQAQNMSEFCQENVFRGVGDILLNVSPQVADEFRKNPQQIENKLGKIFSVWEHSVFPAELTTRIAYENSLKLQAYRYHKSSTQYSHEETVVMTKQILRRPAVLNQEENKRVTQEIDEVLANSAFATELSIKPSVSQRYASCALLTLKNVQSCASGLEKIHEILSYRRNNSLLLPTIKEVLTNRKYIEGLRNAALSIMDRVTSGEPPTGNLFDVISDAFIASGHSESEANDMTWNVMGVLAAGGASVAENLQFGNSSDNGIVKTALSVIASALPLLDVRSAKKGHFFSYPPSVSSTCNNSKPYHFWMSAFLARQVARESGNPEGAAAAAYTTQKAYQMMSRAGARKPARALKVDTFDSFNNVIRMDLAYAAAGAQFGAHSVSGNSSRALDVDATIRGLISEARITANLPAADAERLFSPGGNLFEAYQQWAQRFSPDTAFRISADQ